MKKLISLFMAVVMLFGIGTETFAAYESDKVHTYEVGRTGSPYKKG